MWFEYLGKLLAQIGGKLAAAGAGIAVIALYLIGQRRKVTQAEKRGKQSGRELERERIAVETEKRVKSVKEKSDAIEEEIRRDTADLSDLRRRMRDAATKD